MPRIQDVVVRQSAIHRHRLAGEKGPERRECDLAVHRRIEAALRSEAGKLRARYILSSGPGIMSLLGVGSLETVGYT